MQFLCSRRKPKQPKRRGAAVVETAVVLPVVLFIVLATSEVCNWVFHKQSLCVMAYEGARIAIVPDSTLEDIRMQVEEVALARGVQNVTVSVSPENFAVQPLGTFIEVNVAAGAQLSRTGLFSMADDSVSVSIMKENE